MRLSTYISLAEKLQTDKEAIEDRLQTVCLHQDGTMSVDICGLGREEMVKKLVAILVELDCTEEEYYCKSYDYCKENGYAANS